MRKVDPNSEPNKLEQVEKMTASLDRLDRAIERIERVHPELAKISQNLAVLEDNSSKQANESLQMLDALKTAINDQKEARVVQALQLKTQQEKKTTRAIGALGVLFFTCGILLIFLIINPREVKTEYGKLTIKEVEELCRFYLENK